MIRLRFAPAGTPPTVVEFPEGKNPFDILVASMKRLGHPCPTVDAKADEILRSRRTAAEAGEGKQTSGSVPDVDLLEAPVAQSGERPLRKGEVAGSIPAGGSTPSGVRDTSIAAYRGLQWSGHLGKQQQVVVDFFVANPGKWTRQEIAKATGLSINATCGRVNELLAEPFAILAEADEKKDCSITKNRVNAVVLRSGA